jgi:hypothetical protein
LLYNERMWDVAQNKSCQNLKRQHLSWDPCCKFTLDTTWMYTISSCPIGSRLKWVPCTLQHRSWQHMNIHHHHRKPGFSIWFD